FELSALYIIKRSSSMRLYNIEANAKLFYLILSIPLSYSFFPFSSRWISILKNHTTYDMFHNNITVIFIDLIRSGTFKIFHTASEKTASFMIRFCLSFDDAVY